MVRWFPLLAATLIALPARAPRAEQPPDAGAGDATPDADAPSHGGTIAGTVLWAGSPDRGGCEVHAFDMEGYRGVRGGLEDVVVVAEPVSVETQRLFREHPRDADGPGTFYWSDGSGASVMAVAPDAPLEFSNMSKKPAHIRFMRGRVLLDEMSLAPDEAKVTRLPAGLVRVVDPHTRISGWVFVTPYPSRVSGGNCRFVFGELPAGRYRLSGWYPTEGRRSRTVNVEVGAKVVVVTPLIYGGEPRTR